MNTSLRRRITQTLSLLALVAVCRPAWGIPAFARKYGLRCSACHEAWPKLNNFGQVFKDNGYQLMNDRDAPIWQNLSYFPVTVRITPQWHREKTNRMALDQAPGVVSSHLAGSEYHDFGLRPFRPGHLGGGNAGQEHFLRRASVLGHDRKLPL